MSRSIDTMHLGLDRVIGAWERDGALIDPGPASSIETVLGALEADEPTAISSPTSISITPARRGPWSGGTQAFASTSTRRARRT